MKAPEGRREAFLLRQAEMFAEMQPVGGALDLQPWSDTRSANRYHHPCPPPQRDKGGTDFLRDAGSDLFGGGKHREAEEEPQETRIPARIPAWRRATPGRAELHPSGEEKASISEAGPSRGDLGPRGSDQKRVFRAALPVSAWRSRWRS